MTGFELSPDTEAWLAEARKQPLAEVFPAVARKVGREPLGPGWTTDQAVRALLLIGVPADEVQLVYRYGDADEKQAVLQALSLDEVSKDLKDQALTIVEDAIRTNDQRLLAAALGPYATTWLPQASFRQAVLKCVFAGVPLEKVDGLPARVDDELIRMMTDFAAERAAAGREIPKDLEQYLTASPPRRGV
ncbi:EboA domain-containing protein [Kribbella sp. NPDC006257]|uniref:EboA domain-containing protein n=1 Tax=Kribbella sp. NPDC006257 TaxID=3156738 RepID=UPI0033B6C2C3